MQLNQNELFYATDPLALKRSAKLRDSQAQDHLPIDYLESHFDLKDWVISRFWIPAPETDQDWVQEFDFEDVRSHAIRTGVWELAVEAEESSDESDHPTKSHPSSRKRKTKTRGPKHSDSESSEEEEDKDVSVFHAFVCFL